MNIKNLSEKICEDIIGMRDLYYANIISFDYFENFVNDINKKYKLKFKKVIVQDSEEPFTNIKWQGLNDKECLYSLYVVENL